jgi:hypothetical protein
MAISNTLQRRVTASDAPKSENGSALQRASTGSRNALPGFAMNHHSGPCPTGESLAEGAARIERESAQPRRATLQPRVPQLATEIRAWLAQGEALMRELERHAESDPSPINWEIALNLGDKNVVPVALAARRLGISRDTVIRAIHADPALGNRIGKRWFVHLPRLREVRHAVSHRADFA